MNKEHTFFMDFFIQILWTWCKCFANYSDTFLKLKEDLEVLLNIIVCIISYPSGVLTGWFIPSVKIYKTGYSKSDNITSFRFLARRQLSIYFPPTRKADWTLEKRKTKSIWLWEEGKGEPEEWRLLSPRLGNFVTSLPVEWFSGRRLEIPSKFQGSDSSSHQLPRGSSV